MKAIIRRELKNYLKNPFFWIGLFFIVFQMYQILSPYLHIHYYQQGEAAEELAEENIQRFKEILRDMKPLISEDITLEQLTAKVINDMGHPVKRLEKAKLYERIVRSMLEYLLEQGDVSCYVRDNSVCYCLVK